MPRCLIGASWIARQTRSGVTGISKCVTPSSDSASTMALMTTASASVVPASPPARTPERITWSRHLAERSDEGRQILCKRHRIIHKRGGRRLPENRFVDAMLPECLTNSLCDPAVSLTLEDHWIDRPSDIVNSGVTNDVRRSGLGIDLDLADVAAVGITADLEDLRHARRLAVRAGAPEARRPLPQRAPPRKCRSRRRYRRRGNVHCA